MQYYSHIYICIIYSLLITIYIALWWTSIHPFGEAEQPTFVAELPAGKRMGNLIAVCTQVGVWAGLKDAGCETWEKHGRNRPWMVGWFNQKTHLYGGENIRWCRGLLPFFGVWGWVYYIIILHEWGYNMMKMSGISIYIYFMGIQNSWDAQPRIYIWYYWVCHGLSQIVLALDCGICFGLKL